MTCIVLEYLYIDEINAVTDDTIFYIYLFVPMPPYKSIHVVFCVKNYLQVREMSRTNHDGYLYYDGSNEPCIDMYI